MKKTLWTLVAILAIGVIVFNWKAAPSNGDLVTEGDAVVVSDQKPGDETIVSYAKLSRPGYVTVYSTEAGAKVLLGSSDLLAAGEHRNVVVRHRGRKPSHGATISASIVADNGDGSFSEEGDTEVAAEDDASVSDDASLDTDLTDAELEVILEEAGYTVNEEAGPDSDTGANVAEEEVPVDDSPETASSTDAVVEVEVEAEVQI